MKITIDFKNKKLTLHDDNISMKDLIENLDRIFPNKEWINYVIEKEPIFSNPYYHVTYDNTGKTLYNSTDTTGDMTLKYNL
jgi:phage gpG-like protein